MVKKIIAIALILLVGLFMVSSCGPRYVEPETKEQGTGAQPAEAQQQTESENILQPPALPEE